MELHSITFPGLPEPYNVAPASHLDDKNNPHGVTAAQVRALPNTGGTLNGSLILSGENARLTLEDTDTNSKITMYKNAGVSGGTVMDYGFSIQDFSAVDGVRDSLILCRNQPLAKKLRLLVRKDDDSGDTAYNIYGTHNKPTPAEIGAHPNTWMPSAEQVGAAPAGYGLGETAVVKAWSEVDTLKVNGIYRFTDISLGSIGMPATYGLVAVFASYSSEAWQYLYPNRGETPVLLRHCSAGTWNEWEWVNPPMQLGVEYRTTERWNGKAVYTKLFNFGNLPNTTEKRVSMGFADGEIKAIVGIEGLVYADNGSTVTIEEPNNTTTYINGGYITVASETDRSTQTATFKIKYLKD